MYDWYLGIEHWYKTKRPLWDSSFPWCVHVKMNTPTIWERSSLASLGNLIRIFCSWVGCKTFHNFSDHIWPMITYGLNNKWKGSPLHEWLVWIWSKSWRRYTQVCRLYQNLLPAGSHSFLKTSGTSMETDEFANGPSAGIKATETSWCESRDEERHVTFLLFFYF